MRQLELIVRELLLERTVDLSGPELAAFIDGWSSLLDLLGRPELLFPGGSAAQRATSEELARVIRAAQARVLTDETG